MTLAAALALLLAAPGCHAEPPAPTNAPALRGPSFTQAGGVRAASASAASAGSTEAAAAGSGQAFAESAGASGGVAIGRAPASSAAESAGTSSGYADKYPAIAAEIPAPSAAGSGTHADKAKDDGGGGKTDQKALQWGATAAVAGAVIGLALGGPIGAAAGFLAGLFIGALAAKATEGDGKGG